MKHKIQKWLCQEAEKNSQEIETTKETAERIKEMRP